MFINFCLCTFVYGEDTKDEVRAHRLAHLFPLMQSHAWCPVFSMLKYFNMMVCGMFLRLYMDYF